MVTSKPAKLKAIPAILIALIVWIIVYFLPEIFPSGRPLHRLSILVAIPILIVAALICEAINSLRAAEGKKNIQADHE